MFFAVSEGRAVGHHTILIVASQSSSFALQSVIYLFAYVELISRLAATTNVRQHVPFFYRKYCAIRSRVADDAKTFPPSFLHVCSKLAITKWPIPITHLIRSPETIIGRELTQTNSFPPLDAEVFRIRNLSQHNHSFRLLVWGFFILENLLIAI